MKKSRYHHGDLYQALLEAGELELIEKGVDNFSMRGVARRANVSHAAPAHYFENSNALLTALTTKGFELLLSMQKEKEESLTTEDSNTCILAAGLAYIDFAAKHPGKFRLMFSSNHPDHSDPALKQASDSAFAHLVKLVLGKNQEVEEAIQDDEKMKPVIRTWALVHGIANLYIAGQLGPLEAKTEAEKEHFFSCLLQND